MLHKLSIILLFSALAAGFISCSQKSELRIDSKRYEFGNILDVAYTPDTLTRCNGWFSDAGSWMGFTLPKKDNWVNGFCGPFSLDMNRRQWMAKSAVVVSFADHENDTFIPDSINYFPGEIYLSSYSPNGKINQRLHFVDASTALLSICSKEAKKLAFTGSQWSNDVEISTKQNTILVRHPSGEIIMLTFNPDIVLTVGEHNYKAIGTLTENETHVAISFFTSEKEIPAGFQKSMFVLNDTRKALTENSKRWNGYLNKILRTDMKPEYDRIAVKSAVTLLSNWRTYRGGLLHEGIVPSHAVGYFVGFWAWDSWRFSAALARFEPELAKNNIRAMFDYQQPDGMIIDCIYTDPAENNARDSKPPLVSWAVDEIFTHTNDTSFLKEMYPQLMAYYKWWYNKRDHNKNGMCEYGSTDGTLEAAAWESGMDNAIRFDNTRMVRNNDEGNAWSMNQESVDLNAYLALECRLLKRFAGILGVAFDAPDYSSYVADYFFDKEKGFFFDRRLTDGSFVEEYGCEAYTPLWTNVAHPEQVEKMLTVLLDTTKFSTYIPFPTIAADNPKYNPRGYWRGPIWLDQTYFAIRGLRNYGYTKLADEYTLQVFDRLQGLQEDAPIHENYGTHTGERLKAPHFSWSSSHLLMLYEDYGKTLHYNKANSHNFKLFTLPLCLFKLNQLYGYFKFPFCIRTYTFRRAGDGDREFNRIFAQKI
ncbi:MAG: trehalase family glycosidase [Paludibacter sp.]|nr:trehalase family glycosidase [Paludibacter sp.]MDD4197803.1 trehalase family glycosidase [Paludibacter sp.]